MEMLTSLLVMSGSLLRSGVIISPKSTPVANTRAFSWLVFARLTLTCSQQGSVQVERGDLTEERVDDATGREPLGKRSRRGV